MLLQSEAKMKLTILIDIVGVMLSKGKSNGVFYKIEGNGNYLTGKNEKTESCNELPNVKVC